MTRNEAGFRVTQEALANLERMMFKLYQEKAKYHPQQYYAVMADPLVHEIRKLRAEIDQHIGLLDFDQATEAYEQARSQSPTPAPQPTTQVVQ